MTLECFVAGYVAGTFVTWALMYLFLWRRVNGRLNRYMDQVMRFEKACAGIVDEESSTPDQA